MEYATDAPVRDASGHTLLVQSPPALLPTRWGTFWSTAFRSSEHAAPGEDMLVLVKGDVSSVEAPLVRVHSECLTGDTLGSLRCDCGEQLDRALTFIAAAECGVLIYLPQEGRGIGLFNKLSAYALQDTGLDTVEANEALGLPVDAREYDAAAAILRKLGVRAVRLLTNNPRKCEALEHLGIHVRERVPLPVRPNAANATYLRTKAARMGHLLDSAPVPVPDSAPVTVPVPVPVPVPVYQSSSSPRPSVTIHYAQTLDGRIATCTGNSQWISGDATLQYAHALRASHQAILVGIGTVLADNPRLTVRHVPGPSPLRIVLDSTLRVPLDANVLTDDTVPTIIATTARASQERQEAVRAHGARVLVVDADSAGRVDLCALLEELAALGVRSVLIEGGAGAITSALRARVVDRFTACIAPKVVGRGIDAVGNLDILRLRDALTFTRSSFTPVGDDIIFEGWVDHRAPMPMPDAAADAAVAASI